MDSHEIENQNENPVVAVVTPEKILELKSKILDSSLHMEDRNRCVFTLSSIKNLVVEAIDALVECLNSPTCSALLKHEIAYVIGQMKNPYAIPALSAVLGNENEAVIVRHEAGESLGAIGTVECLEVLTKYSNDPIVEIAETCQIAIDRIHYFDKKKTGNKEKKEKKDNNNRIVKTAASATLLSEQNNNNNHHQEDGNSSDEEVSSIYLSVDPAPSLKIDKETSVKTLGELMMDKKLPLFERYRALFALRDIGTKEAVEEMIAGFSDSSALFRHEVAFVMGQLQNPASKDILTKILENENEHAMVRHEAAEALGAISTEETLPILKKFLEDEHDVVRESCSVALDIHEWYHSNQFQYADGLTK